MASLDEDVAAGVVDPDAPAADDGDGWVFLGAVEEGLVDTEVLRDVDGDCVAVWLLLALEDEFEGGRY